MSVNTPQIIFEDSDIMVINKPYGVVVNRADTTSGIETIQDFAEKFIEKSSGDEEFNSRGGIVHRLDKDTSGVLVLAKNSQAFQNLKNQFKDRNTTKKYLALVHGLVEPAQGTIDAPIERSPFNRMHFGVFPGGREAQTSYLVLKQFTKYALLEVEPKTGRTHQIRVHMKYINHPIVSDPIYGGRKQVREDLKVVPRLFLHAKELKLRHPVSGLEMAFEAPLLPDLNDALDLLS